MSLFGVLFFLLCIVTSIASQLAPVDHLPGHSDAKYHPKMHSGYLSTHTYPCDVFSILVEADESPETKPLIIFSNGGPGASSLQGFIIETGPVLLESDGSTLLTNPERWNKLGNVLFMELPGQVGFSESKVTKWNDHMFAITFFEALAHLQAQMPHLLKPKTQVYLTGESYFGAYGVNTMSYILTNTSRLGLDFKGLFIGNGVTNSYFDDKSAPLFMREHAIISESSYLQALQTCGGDFADPSEDCRNAVDGLWMSVFTAGLNPYNLYDTCIPVAPGALDVEPRTITQLTLLSHQFPSASERTSAQPDPLPCVSIKQMEYYFNQKEVQTALHVRHVPRKWNIVNEDLSQNYTQTKDCTAFLPAILHNKVPVRYYSGDTDLIVNVKGTLTSIEIFAQKHKMEVYTKWAPWKDRNNRLGGFEIGWSASGQRDSEVRVVVVRGGGHMAASNRAREVFDLLQRFIDEA